MNEPWNNNQGHTPPAQGPGAPYGGPGGPNGPGGLNNPSGPGGYTPPPAPPNRPRPAQAKNPMSGVSAGTAMVGIALLVLVVAVLTLLFNLGSAVSGLLRPAATYTTPHANSFSVITISGTIQSLSNDAYTTASPGYCHGDTLQHIKDLAENDDNTGILLYMNTPGGGVYESDELYLALEDYKEKTGRPVWAYMSSTCASGGVYVAAAADHIAANRNTTTGSVGVYIALTDTSGLYVKLGIETVLVKSGENKGVGMEGVPITEAQRQVYQGVVDECYEQFIGLLAEGRGLPLDEVRKLADGRVYTGAQALELGLVDELANWDDTLAAFEEETGATPFYPSFNRQSQIARLVGGLTGELPVGDAEAALNAAEQQQTGVPMALYAPAA